MTRKTKSGRTYHKIKNDSLREMHKFMKHAARESESAMGGMVWPPNPKRKK